MKPALAIASLLLFAFIADSSGQSWPRRSRREPTIGDRNGVERWHNDPRFPDDTFRFVRLRPENHYKWATDYPDSDLNRSSFPSSIPSLRSIPSSTPLRPAHSN